MQCNYNKDEFCTNDQCPMCADYCPVPDDEGVCRFEEREEVIYRITPKGCFDLALNNHQVCFSHELISAIWDDFVDLMTRQGYIEEEE